MPDAQSAVDTMLDDVVVVVPTYNERDNLPQLVAKLIKIPVADLRVLVVDDNSPDGTGRVADVLRDETYGFVQVLHRRQKDGLGRAYLAGIEHALTAGASVVIQMDADLSHPVEAIPEMVALLADPGIDVAVGSRYVAGGSVSQTWPRRRRLLSRLANVYVDRVLHLDVADATSGFKAWCAPALRRIDLGRLDSRGYAFQIEMAHACVRLGLGVAETPIHFSDRTSGRSKMTLRVQLESVRLPWRLRRRASTPAPAAGVPVAIESR